ncbi:ATP-binding cassette domain-containing protein [uncultured Jatrophihabitans sp.]|uniref:AAA family ATPase n=1 Tax=uncultured Jatrophihabitans sp. TaxID=1610747 RepID=UPI0035CC7DCD
MFLELPVTAVRRDPHAAVALDPDTWPADIPAVAELLTRGLELGPLTVLVGENGSGKSTLVEAIAQAYGLSSEGGSTGARHSTRESESALHRVLRVQRGIGASKWGFFLRAETMHGYYSYLEARPSRMGRPDPVFHELSHGESFLSVLEARFEDPGFYVLDEPESALSFSGCLALVGLLHRMAGDGRRQALVATHSPIIAATPGARILEVGEHGLREVAWDQLELVQNWADFLADPSVFLRYVLEPDRWAQEPE